MPKFISNKFTTDIMSLLTQASLIVTPNGYKEGKLYSVIPSDGSGDLSVTRATTATRVNSSGLVELVPYNLLSYSEDFSNGAWISGEVSLTSGQSSPLGTNTAFKITGTSATNAFLLQVGIPVTSGNTYTASVYLKGSTSGSVSLRVDSGSTAPNNPVSYTTEWQRFTYTFTAGSTTATAVLGGYNTWTGSEEIFVYGFQLVEGSVAKDYQKTETRLNIPRLDYSNGTCPSILVEPQRTNLLTWSSSFDNAAWQKEDLSVTANASTSPSGNTDADKLVPNTNNNDHTIYQSASLSGSYTLSVYAKADGYNYIFLGANNNPTTLGVFFNLTDGTVSYNTGGFTASITDEGNGWYRCSVNNTSWPTTEGLFCTSSNGTSVVHTGNGTSGVLVWGAQLEVGSYATSYIPTTSASVTRNADVISKTGISSLIGQTEGTLFVDAYITGKDSSNGSILFATDKVSSGALIRIIYTSTNALRFDVFDGSSFQCLISAGAYNVGDRVKVAGGYKNNDFVMYVNGTQIGTDTSGSVPATDTANINTSIYGDTNGSFVNAAALWKTRLTNTQLEALTGTGFNTYAEMASYYNYVLQ